MNVCALIFWTFLVFFVVVVVVVVVVVSDARALLEDVFAMFDAPIVQIAIRMFVSVLVLSVWLCLDDIKAAMLYSCLCLFKDMYLAGFWTFPVKPVHYIKMDAGYGWLVQLVVVKTICMSQWNHSYEEYSAYAEWR